MLALLDLFKKVWKNAAIPICANDHPIETTSNNVFDVLTKNGVAKTKVPTR